MIGEPLPVQANNQLSQTPFIWGPSGTRLSPEQIFARQQIAQDLSTPDFSPVEGGALGAIGRGAQNIFGALQSRSLEKQDEANRADSDALLQSVLGGSGDAVTAALTSPYASPQVQQFAKMQWERQNPKPQAPSEFERTLIGAGIDPAGAQGKGLYAQRATTMASPQPQFISDGMGGGTWVTPPPQGLGTQASPISSPQALGAELPAGWSVDSPTPSPVNTSIPSGNPLDPWSPR